MAQALADANTRGQARISVPASIDHGGADHGPVAHL